METNPQHQPAAGRPVAPRRAPGSRQAFTLTELLVVITIIAVLASLVTVAAVKAIAAAKRTQIQLEIGQIAQSMEDFKSEYGAYPPSGMNDGSNNQNGKSIGQMVVSDFERMFKKAFPRGQEPRELIQALAGGGPGGNKGLSPLTGGLRAGEAVYFWLGGFSDDPQYPISGKGGPSFETGTTVGEVIENRNRRYEFDLTRLVPRASDGLFDEVNGRYLTYEDPRNGKQRRINLWQYVPSGFEQPFVYFDVSRHKPADYEMPASVGGSIYALTGPRQGRSGISNALTDIIYSNQGKFQILHAGLDDSWGDNAKSVSLAQYINDADFYLPFPAGPFTGEIADNLTNFTSGELQSAQEE